jgi:hypothetical protein
MMISGMTSGLSWPIGQTGKPLAAPPQGETSLTSTLLRSAAEIELHPRCVPLRLDVDIIALPPSLPDDVVEEWKREVRRLWTPPRPA